MFIVMSLSQGSATSKQLIHAPFLKCHVSVLTHHSLYNQKCNQHPKFCDRFMKLVSYWSWSNPEHLKFYTTASWYHHQTSKELSSHAKLTSTLSIQDGKQNIISNILRMYRSFESLLYICTDAELPWFALLLWLLGFLDLHRAVCNVI